MFEKLLSNLPYNPNLKKQIGFYIQRMRHEQSIRRTGMVFMVLAFMIQFFAFVAPPQSTTAYSSSDMINGGIASKADAVRACRQNLKNYGDVMWNFKITCDDIANSSVTSIRSTDFGGNLYSWSWLPYGKTNPHSGKPTNETPYNLAKVAETIYARRLASADTIPYSTYKVLKGVTSEGRTFWIMFGCGNLMLVGTPPQAEVCRKDGEVYYAGHPKCKETPPPPPVLTCSYDHSIPKDSPKCVPCPYNPNIAKANPKCVPPCPYDSSIPASDSRCTPPCPYDSTLPKDSPQCKPCTDAGSANALACITERKAASNRTQNIVDANDTTANPGDVIVYSLFADNRGKADVPGFVMQENLNDVMDYATIVDLHGGTLGENNIVTWHAATIRPNSTLSHQVTVRVKNPVPQNQPPAGDPLHFDHVMTNVYGNAVNIKVSSPLTENPVVTVSTSEELPKTGPGEAMVLAGAIIILAGYFVARTRLLVDESVIVMQETNAGSI